MAEITTAGDVNDESVAKHIAGKFNVNKEVASSAAQNAKYGSAPLLFWAAYGGHEKAIAALLKAGAKKDVKSKTNETPLQIAVRKERSDAVIKLLGGVPKPAAAPAAAAAKPAAAPAAKPAAAAAAKPAAAAAAKPAAAPAAKPAAAPAAKPAAAPAAKPAAAPAAKPAAAPAAKPAAAPAAKPAATAAAAPKPALGKKA